MALLYRFIYSSSLLLEKNSKIISENYNAVLINKFKQGFNKPFIKGENKCKHFIFVTFQCIAYFQRAMNDPNKLMILSYTFFFYFSFSIQWNIAQEVTSK